MYKFIKEKLVEVYRTASTDKYGQIGKHNFNIKYLFGEQAEKIMEFVKTDKSIISIGCYGLLGVNYYAVASINDADIKQACKEALSKNQNYLDNINSW